MSEKPFLIMVTHNRPKETMTTLQSLEYTTDFSEVDFVIVDNGSTGGLPMRMVEWANGLMRRVGRSNIEVLSLPKNIGCPRALNLVLGKYRQPGQPVVKIDNDVVMVTSDWVCKIQNLIAERRAMGRETAMIAAWYEEILQGRLLRVEGDYQDKAINHVSIIIGHTVWHTGEFMDRVGYFDVLHPDHLYGFEDLLLSHKATVMGWEMLVWEGWEIENIQRSPSLGMQVQNEHVAAMRPYYNERHAAIADGGTLKTGFDGNPIDS